MVTCNKIPLAQHARREKRLKLNTVTLREALQAHTNSRADAPSSSSFKALVSQVRFNLEGCDIFYETEPCQQKQQKGVIKKGCLEFISRIFIGADQDIFKPDPFPILCLM